MSRRKIRGILGIFLAAALLLSCIPLAFGAFAAEGGYDIIASTSENPKNAFDGVEVKLAKDQSIYFVLDAYTADGALYTQTDQTFWDTGLLFQNVNLTVSLNGTQKAAFGSGYGIWEVKSGFTYAYSYTARDAVTGDTADAHLLDNLAPMVEWMEKTPNNLEKPGWCPGEEGVDLGTVTICAENDTNWSAMLAGYSEGYVGRSVLQFTAAEAGTYTIGCGKEDMNLHNTVFYLLTDCAHKSATTVEGTEVPATCTTAGKKASIECSDCGKTIPGASTAKLGHNYVDGICSRCNDEEADPKYDVVASATGMAEGKVVPNFQNVQVKLKKGESLYIVVDPVNAEDGQPVGGGWQGVLAMDPITVAALGAGADGEDLVKAQYGTGANGENYSSSYTYRYSYTERSVWDAAADKTTMLLDNLTDMGAFTEGQWGQAWYTGTPIKAAPAEYGMVAMVAQGEWGAILSNASDNYVARAVLQYTATEDGTYVVNSGAFNDFKPVTLYLLKEVTGYVAEISGPTAKVKVDADGENVAIKVDVTNIKVGDFAAAELTLTYDPTRLDYAGIDGMSPSEGEGSSDGYKITDTADGMSQIKISDFGEPKAYANGVYTYTINFTAKSVTDSVETTVTLDAAAFGTQESAISTDLTPAIITAGTATFTIMPADHSVTLGDGLSSNATTVEHGSDYTFTKSNDGIYYDYTSVTATMGGNSVNVITNDDGSYTIENVTGDLNITAERNEKAYDVTIKIVDTEGVAVEDDTNNKVIEKGATYNKKYSYDLPDDVPAGEAAGYTYTPGTVTIGGNEYTSGGSYDDLTRTYTIDGSDITGAIVINIVRAVQDPTRVKVTNTGTDLTVNLTDDQGNSIGESVEKGTNITLSFTPEDGYIYTVKVTVGEASETFTVTATDTNLVDGKFSHTITRVQENVTIDAKRVLDFSEDNSDVTSYLELNETAMWLITINDHKLAGETTYTYNDEPMFWSEEYKAYCILVISETEPELVADDFEIVGYAADEVDYGMDVNMSLKVDTNDAQLVYNMYNVKYLDFDTVTVAKFLRADINGDKTVNVEDAAAIVNSVLGITA